MAEPGLRITGLGLQAGERALVSGLDLALRPGELVALVGASGAGKSLSARACLGLLPPGLRHAAGTIEINVGDVVHRLTGAPSDAAALRALRGRALGWLPQDSRGSLNPVWSVGAQLRRALRHAGRPAGPEAVEALLLEAGLREPARVAQAYAHALSGGMAQRVALALALAGRPPLLLADEPTTGLDSTVQAAVMASLRARVDAGLGLLFITHDLGLVRAYADRLLILDAGRVVEEAAGGGLDRCTSPAARSLIAGLRALDAAPPPPALPAGAPLLLEAEGLGRQYSAGPPWRRRSVNAVQDVNLRILGGASIGLVGESGSGKTTLARLLAGATAPTAGRLWRAPGLQAATQLLFQQPEAHLDPDWTVRALLAESLRAAARRGARPAEPQALIEDALQRVGLSEKGAAKMGELSGGERRRVGIARLRLLQPRLLLADEPTAGLDAALRAEILQLLTEARAAVGPEAALLLISHDLQLVRAAVAEVLVMLGGRVIEALPAAQLGAGPHHPYTEALLVAAGLRPGAPAALRPPAPEGCAHQPSCAWASAACAVAPRLRAVAPGHRIACHAAAPEPLPSAAPEPLPSQAAT